MKALTTLKAGTSCAVLSCLVLFSTGCADSPPEAPAKLTSPATQEVAGNQPKRWSGPIPEFTGPWATEFRDAYEYSGSDFERAVLEDGVITDLELAEVRTRFRACLEVHGATDVDFADSGAWSLLPPKGMSESESNAFTDKCSDQTGEGNITALYAWHRRNPQHLDENTMMAACLVRIKAKGPGYAAGDFARDSEVLTGGLSETPAFTVCNADPLGLFEKRDK